MDNFLETGKIINTHGLKGYVKVQPWTDYPEIFENFEYLYIEDKKYSVDSILYQKNNVLIKLGGVDSVSEAEKLKGKILLCEKDDLGDLEQDTYFVADLIGCLVYENDKALGKLTYILPAGGADVYEITGDNGETIYLPAIKENILNIDICEKKITVKLPKGLL